jgi:KDO2-lipid IV(A) lauroyltransferase
LKPLFRLLSLLPLCLLHRLGALLGWVAYVVSPRYAARLQANLRQAGYGGNVELLNQAVEDAGKSIVELPAIWLRSRDRTLALMDEVHGWKLVEDAHRSGKGIIFLTPHMGCFEITSLYYAARHPITVLYRPPKLAWLEPLMQAGRSRGQVELATTDLSGVRRLLKALRRGEAVGLLPDQVPGNGEGTWAPFFGQPAYTMTLVGRLVEATGAAVILAYAERLSGGRGYVLRLSAPDEPLTGEGSAAALNRAIENLVRECPQQYLWSYNRYKMPAGAEHPPVRSAPGLASPAEDKRSEA